MRLGIYGGAFSPVHKAHVDMAKAFAESYALDKLLIIPTGEAPHKHISEEVGAEDRLEMCKLAFKEIENAEISDIEIRREGKSYTVITLRELADADTEIFFLCGSDKIPTLEHWYCIDEIFRLCTIVYVKRSGENKNEGGKVEEYRAKYGAKIDRLDACIKKISSKDIRRCIESGESISELVPSSVETFIREKGLYLNKNI